MDELTLPLFDRVVTTEHPKRCSKPYCHEPARPNRTLCQRHARLNSENSKRRKKKIRAAAKETLLARAAELPRRRRPLSERVELLKLGAKKCSMCGEAKPLDAFAIRWPGKETRQSQCRDCNAKNMRKWSKTPQGRAAQEAWQERRPDREHVLRWRRDNPVKAACHRVFARAKVNGKVTPEPCEVCGDTNVHGHHTDYAKPLDVMWLCPTHHAAWHRIHGEGKNGS